jgi:hypothetical protein
VHRRAAGGGFGAFVRAYNYDGLGRLTRAQSPYPDPDTFDPEHPGGTNRIERFYYDGVRRIQEVVIDPVSSMGEALMGASGSAAQAAANQTQQQSGQSNAALTLEEEATSLSIEAAQTSALTGGGTVPGFQVFAEREYIWGPGEGWGVAGTDELLAQFDRTGALTFAITDAGGDMVALVDSGGSSGRARVVGQWTYDAYGNVLSADHIHPHAYTRVGHKGLIFDRLDVGVADRGDDGSFKPGQFVGHVSCEFDTPRIVPFARGLYHNRNRVYMPELGRLAQADPNASGQTVLDLPVYHGRAFRPATISFDIAARYADGGSLFAYMGGNPWQRSDAMGLFFFDMAVRYAQVGHVAGKIAHGLTSVYSENLSFDVDWAMDWSQGDDWHSRLDSSWIARVYNDARIDDAVNGQLDPTGGLGEYILSSGRNDAVEMATLLYKGRLITSLAGKFHLHHVLPRYFRYIIDRSSNFGVRIPDGLHRHYHEYVSREMANRLGSPYMRSGQAKWQDWLEREAVRRYGGNISAVQDEVKRMLQTLTDEWGNKNGLPGLGDCLKGLL